MRIALPTAGFAPGGAGEDDPRTSTAERSRREADLEAFVRERTAVAPVPLAPELSVHQATEVTPLWHATQRELDGWDPSPYWAFPWAGGQALARHLLDAPALVRGRAVFDFAAGSALCAIAALRAGAARATACDLDPLCAVVVRLNAALNGVALDFRGDDPIGDPLHGFDVVLAGDVFYEQPLASRAREWLGSLARAGKLVLAGDPGRSYSPSSGFEVVSRHVVPIAGDVEAAPALQTRVLRFTG